MVQLKSFRIGCLRNPGRINLRVIKVFHDWQINEHGGLSGLRDEGLPASAL